MKTIGRLMMAVTLITAGASANAQQAADATVGAQAAASSTQPAAPKKTMEEKAAIAGAIFAAGFGAFRAIKAATQAPAAQSAAPPMAAAPAK